jgi:hypothetical protein
VSLSLVQKEILMKLFWDWATPLREAHLEGGGGLPNRKFFIALYQALYGPLSLPEIADEMKVGSGAQVIRNLRTKPDFKSAAQEAAQGFAAFMVREVLAEVGQDSLRRLVLTELLIMLPGFDIGRNEIIEKLAEAICRLENDPTKRPGFKLLHDYLLCYRDVVRLAHHYAKDSMKPGVEEKVGRAVSHLQEKVAGLVKIGRENGTLLEGMAEAIGAVNLSLTFLSAYSKIVI